MGNKIKAIVTVALVMVVFVFLYQTSKNGVTMCTDISYVPVSTRDCKTLRAVKLSPIPPLSVSLPETRCLDGRPPVPKQIFAVNGDGVFSAPLTALATEANASFRGLDDARARGYVAKHCGVRAAHAYDCFVPPSYRADLFRFCALYAEGGIYLDSDLVPAVGLHQMYNRCENVTAGADGAPANATEDGAAAALQAGGRRACLAHRGERR